MKSHKENKNAIETLSRQFAKHFPEKLKGARLIGREAEYPLVSKDGDAANVRKLWEPLLDGGGLKAIYETPDLIVGLSGQDCDFSLEVGWGTMELITRPCSELGELAEIQETYVKRLVKAANEFDFNVLGYGIQPKTAGSLELMSPKKRYGLLLERIGDAWLWFTSTASDQVHVDITQEEVAPMVSFGNLMAPVFIALCGNSSIYAGENSSYCSSREAKMGEIFSDSHRHGMLEKPVITIQEWIAFIVDQEFLMDKKKGQYYLQHNTFYDYLLNHEVDFDSFLMHDHYLWNSARPRTAHGTIELRAACQQPWEENMVVAALGLALIEEETEISAWLDSRLSDDLWSSLRRYHTDVIRDGLLASEPFDGFLTGILERCEYALDHRGNGESIYLKPLRKRIEEKMNPAQVARKHFIEGKLPQLLEYSTISVS